MQMRNSQEFLTVKIRSIDLNMLTFFGAREHSLEDWKDLVANADSRFAVEHVNVSGGLIVIGWKG